MMSELSHDESVAYGVNKLHEWVMKESGWTEQIKARCHAALRQAVLEFVQDEDRVWACSVWALRLLAETISFDESSLTGNECKTFLAAAKVVVDTIRNNADNADDVRSEVDELRSLERITGLRLSTQIERLEDHANSLDERETDDQTTDPEAKYLSKAPVVEEFDVDRLFTGLLDR
jgi:hypothetical protein